LRLFSQFLPDVVTLDIIMPKMDGLSRLEHLTRSAAEKALMDEAAYNEVKDIFPCPQGLLRTAPGPDRLHPYLRP
jgi:chemotaxis response regulator CheB